MDVNVREDLFNKAKKWVLSAGQTIRENMNHPLIVNTKSNPNDLVTSMDKETEIFLVTKIKKNYPDHLILGEEGYGDEITSLDGTIWIIDPIDGTTNFIHQKRNFAISIGIYHNGIGEIGFIYDVMADVLYSARKGEGAYKNNVKLGPLRNVRLEEAILGLNHHWLCENRLVNEQTMHRLVKKIRGARTYGSAALEFAYVAEGILDGYLSMRLSPWDIAAGIIIVNEVGGITTTHLGEPLDMLIRQPIVSCNNQLHKSITKDYLEKGKK